MKKQALFLSIVILGLSLTGISYAAGPAWPCDPSQTTDHSCASDSYLMRCLNQPTVVNDPQQALPLCYANYYADVASVSAQVGKLANDATDANQKGTSSLPCTASADVCKQIQTCIQTDPTNETHIATCYADSNDQADRLAAVQKLDSIKQSNAPATTPQIQNTNVTRGLAAPLTYSPLEPLPGLSQSQLTACGGTVCLPALMNALFRILFTAGALFAVIMLVVGGISYIMSAGGESTGEARSRMTAALWGLLLLAASWLILYTVNPKLLNFDLCPAGLDSAGKCATAGISANGSGSPDDRQQAVSSASDINSQINTCRNQGKKPVVSGGAVVCN